MYVDGLQCTIRNRQKSNYGQRCTPVSADDYNLDNISEYASIRRKGIMRASKRSYGNLAFDDPVSKIALCSIRSKPALISFCSRVTDGAIENTHLQRIVESVRKSM